MTTSTTLVTGARGTVGAGLIRRLHGLGHPVRAASQAPDRLDVPAGVPTVALDLTDPSTFAPALTGVEDVFLYAEPAAVDALLTAATTAGVRRVVLLSSDSVTLPGGEDNALARHHLVVERAVLASGLTSVLLRPGAFASNALGWADAIRAERPVEQAYPECRVDPIHAEDIVDVAELAITTPALDGQAVSLGGPELLSFCEQVGVLAALLERRIELVALTREQAAERMGRFMPVPFVAALLDYWSQGQDMPDAASNSVERITGRPGRTFRQWAEENRAAFG